MTVPPVCECHGEAMYWHKGCEMLAGGLWRCRVRKREVQAVHTDKRRVSNLRYYHAPNGGYVRRRKRDLQTERDRIQARLAELNEEATRVAQP